MTKSIVKPEMRSRRMPVERGGNGGAFVPRFDILETGTELVLYGDLPGVTADDLDVSFENQELTIYGRVAPRQEGIQFLYGEYGIGDFYRTFAIGEAIEIDKISAELKNGVLTLRLPKVPEAQPKKIEVKAG